MGPFNSCLFAHISAHTHIQGIFHAVFRLPRMRVSVFPVVDILRKLLTPQSRHDFEVTSLTFPTGM